MTTQGDCPFGYNRRDKKRAESRATINVIRLMKHLQFSLMIATHSGLPIMTVTVDYYRKLCIPNYYLCAVAHQAEGQRDGCKDKAVITVR